MDLLDTLISSNRFKANIEQWKSKADFEYNEKLVEELLDNLIAVSKDHFVIAWYDNSTYTLDYFSIPSKFNNLIEINSQIVDNESHAIRDKKRLRYASQNSVVVRVKSDKTTFCAISNSTHWNLDNHSFF